MAVSVNLREVFPSDSQSNLTEKLNFNFNQLLLLGLGLKGDKGDKGDTGPIGPVGLTGAAGQRGSIAFAVQNTSTPTDSANTSTLANSIDGDMFINTTKIYVKGATVSGTWDQIVDFASLVNAQSLQDPYKVIQLGLGSGSTTSKHAKFLRTKGVDSNNTALASTHPQYYTGTQPDNTQLVLSNFDEAKTYRISNGSLVSNSGSSDSTFEYTALQTIVAYLPSTLVNYRHQFELGSVDGDSVTVGGNSQYYVLTPSEQNLKFRKYRVTNNSVTGGLYNRAELDLSGLAGNTNSMNGEIALITNKRDTNGATVMELGVSNSEILTVKYPAAGLTLDGLYMAKGTFQAGIGLKSDDATTLLVKTTTANVRVNDLIVNQATAGITVGHAVPASKWVSLGSAIKVQNSRVIAGIPFPAVQSLVSDVNTLDDYREGTWTPSISMSTTIPTGTHFSPSGWSTTGAAGTYVKIGQVVFYTFTIKVKAESSATSFASALSLGLSTQSSVTPGSETPYMRIQGFPNWSPIDADNHCEISMYATSATLPTLRETDVTTSITVSGTPTTFTLYPIVPKTAYAKMDCLNFGTIQNGNWQAAFILYGHKYQSSGRIDSVASRLTPYDFLATSGNASFVTIIGSGYYFTNMTACSDPTQSTGSTTGGGAPIGGF